MPKGKPSKGFKGEDLTGFKVGWLTVLGFDGGEGKSALWLCSCKCGSTCSKPRQILKRLNRQRLITCGCQPKSIIDITGQKFGMLTALELLPVDGNNCSNWLCQCDCGNFCKFPGFKIMSTHYNSCGCVNEKRMHGLGKHPIRGSWNAMMTRCHNSNVYQYKNYGGRGITVCEAWRQASPEGFLNFYSWAIDKWASGLSLERIDVNGNYCPENCKWATRKEQGNNTTRVQRHQVFGQRLTRAETSDLYAIDYTTLKYLTNRRGLTLEQAVSHALKHGLGGVACRA